MIKLLLAAVFLSSVAAEAHTRRAPLNDPVLLNIGFVCRWQSRCIKVQKRGMKAALSYVTKHRPPAWKVQVCNRNSSRKGTRKDWIGFNNCIRNPAVRPAAAKKKPKRR